MSGAFKAQRIEDFSHKLTWMSIGLPQDSATLVNTGELTTPPTYPSSTDRTVSDGAYTTGDWQYNPADVA